MCAGLGLLGQDVIAQALTADDLLCVPLAGGEGRSSHAAVWVDVEGAALG